MSALIIDDQTKATRVAERLRADIINNVFVPGSRITIKEICERYGVSNVPVREALRTLESEKLVEISAYKGATILQLDEQYVSDIYEILRTLQLLIYETALPALTEEKLQYIRGINEKIASLKDNREDRLRFMELDRLFHNSIGTMSSNKPALELYDNYHKMIVAIRKAGYMPEYSRILDAAGEHEALIAALEKKDVLALKLATDAHGRGAERSFFSQNKN